MSYTVLKGGLVVNEGRTFSADVLIKGNRIEKIDPNIQVDGNHKEIDVSGSYVLPGVIDDQVHFREPGLTHKANIFTESRAAVAGGTTTFMEMPNTKPPALTQDMLEDKYEIGRTTALANYSFFMGASNDNIEEVLKTPGDRVCGVKIFMGSSTGNMLVDEEAVLENIFSKSPMLIATHCEDEQTVRDNTEKYVAKFGDQIPMPYHPLIRSVEACYLSSSKAVELAKKHDSRLHILHISTSKELALFDNTTPLHKKRITSEACVHHLYFDSSDYYVMGTKIKCNPAIKERSHKEAILEAVLDDRIDIIATDHAPHTIEEKSNPYTKAPSGLPLVQHSLLLMLDFHKQGKISMEKMVEKMCHAPADCFRVKDRGYLREGYFADIVVVDPNQKTKVEKDNILYKCQWSPLEGKTFDYSIAHTFVNGHLAYTQGKIDDSVLGERVMFNHE